MAESIVATDREETEPCEKGTVGCSVDHEATRKADPSVRESDCEPW